MASKPLQSWVESANVTSGDFPLENLPYVCFIPGGEEMASPGVVIGDQVVGLIALDSHDLLKGVGKTDERELAIMCPDATGICDATPKFRRELRAALTRLLSKDTPTLRDDPEALEEVMFPLAECELYPPVTISNYSDFYASIHHATTVGSMFRPDNPLLPNYKHVPIGYHGRSSSIVVGGTDIARPRGQTKADDAPAPSFGLSKMVDFELEVGAILGGGSSMGEPIAIGDAPNHIVGLCLVNDWSARDIQKWEYQPLGPFLSKNFATSVSPFLVPIEALEPFRCPAYRRPAGDPAPLDYLIHKADQDRGGFEITLEVTLQSSLMRSRGMAPMVIAKNTAFKDMYWTFAQMLAHHTSNGCNIIPGDLIASGTVSGNRSIHGPQSEGCMLELTWDGAGKPRRPIELPTGEKRTFLEDGDRVSIRGWCERPGVTRIGLGMCEGTVLPPRA